MQPFSPVGDTVNVAVTATSQALALTSLGTMGGSVRIGNIGTQTVFIAFGSSSVTTTTAAGIPILPNTVEVFALGGVTHVAAIATAVGSTLYATSGQGV